MVEDAAPRDRPPTVNEWDRGHQILHRRGATPRAPSRTSVASNVNRGRSVWTTGGFLIEEADFGCATRGRALARLLFRSPRLRPPRCRLRLFPLRCGEAGSR